MNKLRERLQRMMTGRYGVDGLGRFLVYLSMFLLAASILFQGFFLQILAFACLIWCYFRMFSRNYGKRYGENQKYEALRYAVMERFRKSKFRLQEKKTNHIYTCPTCGQKIRVPRGKGRVSIHCPKCNTDFIKKS